MCRESGLLPTEYCTHTITEYFLDGTIPTEYCYECRGTKKEEESFNVEIFKRKKTSLQNSSDSRSENKKFYRGEEVSPFDEESLFYNSEEPDDGEITDIDETPEEQEPAVEFESPTPQNDTQSEEQEEKSFIDVEQPASQPETGDTNGPENDRPSSKPPDLSEEVQDSGASVSASGTREYDIAPEETADEDAPSY